MRKLILRMRWILTAMSRIPGLPNAISPPYHNAASLSSTLPQCQGPKKGKSHVVDEDGGKSSQYHKPPHHHNVPSSSSTFPQCQGQNVVQSEELLVDEVGGVNGHSVSCITMSSTCPSP